MIEYAERPNKTQQKRQMAEIRQLAERLTALDPGTVAQFDLSPQVLKSIREARALKACSARKRLLKYISKLLLDEDLTKLKAHFDQNSETHRLENQRFHALEIWRDKLIAEGDTALQAFLDSHPQADRQALRQAMLAAKKEQASGKPVGAAKKLFRLLRDQSVERTGQ